MVAPFEEQLRAAARKAGLEPKDGPAMLAHVTYDRELAVKRDVVRGFLKALAPADGLSDLVAAPMPRGYRTTSRRRVWRDRRGTRLVHGDAWADPSADTLEPAAHHAVFARIDRFLMSRYDPLVDVLSHVVVRGTYEQHVLILNVNEINADIVRSARKWANAVVKEVPAVVTAWLFVDPKGSRYYLDTDRPLFGVAEKKLLGERVWRQQIGEVTYQVGVFSFSQVNLAMAPTLIDVVRSLAEVTPNDVLLDLYGGYGLFGAALAGSVKEIVTMDSDETTVDNARYNIRRAGGKVRAYAAAVTAKSVHKFLDHADVVILDPPRSGTDSNVITAVADLQPRTAVEVFCGPDEIRRSIAEWKAADYEVTRIVPMDLFPGTGGLEVAVAFQRRASRAQPKTSR